MAARAELGDARRGAQLQVSLAARERQARQLSLHEGEAEVVKDGEPDEEPRGQLPIQKAAEEWGLRMGSRRRR